MRSFAFFWNEASFAEKHARPTPCPIDHVGFRHGQPFENFQPGDELFIVGIRQRRVRLAGRLIVGQGPMLREQAVAHTRRDDLIDKPMVCLAAPAHTDHFRGTLDVPLEITRSLALFNSDGSPTQASSLRTDNPDPNLFRACPRLSAASADQLRALLQLPVQHAEAAAPAAETPDMPLPEGQDDDAYRQATIKSRRGQRQFRTALLQAYQGRCVVTNCRVESLLEAAHITPHAQHTDYRVSNGLLLRADIHTLFDLNLLCITPFHEIKVSASLRNSEYWTYHNRKIERFPEKMSDQPSHHALAARAALFQAHESAPSL